MVYKTLEQQIMELWESRGLKVKIIKFHAEKGNGVWTVIAPLKEK